MRSTTRSLAAAAVGVGALLTVAGPAASITGGQDDDPTDPQYDGVGLLFFYQADGRYRCSGTLVSPQVFLTAAHCTSGDVGDVIVTFDTDVATDVAEGREVLPRAIDDPGTGLEGSGYTDGLWIVEYDEAGNPVLEDVEEGEDPQFPDGVVRHPYDNSGFDDGSPDGAPVWHTGTAVTHPYYSDFTDLDTWNDVGVVILDQPVTGVTTYPLAEEGYLDGYSQRELVKELFRTVGYGTEVRQAASGPQTPTPQSYPLRRQLVDEKGQKLTPQILQLNGNEHDPFGGGGTCFGDSGGPAFGAEGQVVGVTSYGYTSNCRYLGGYQRVDIPGVDDWLDCLIAEAPAGAAAAEATCAPLAAPQ